MTDASDAPDAHLEPPADVHLYQHQPIPWQLHTIRRTTRTGRLTLRYAAPDRPELHALEVSFALHSRDADDPMRRPNVELPPLPPADVLRLYLERAHHARDHGSPRWPCRTCATTTPRAPALTLAVRSVRPVQPAHDQRHPDRHHRDTTP